MQGRTSPALSAYVQTTDLYINKLDAGLATVSIAKGDPFKLTSPAQHALRRVIPFWNFLADNKFGGARMRHCENRRVYGRKFQN